MNITILDNRDVIINSSDNLGTQNENNASIINFSFPESLVNANKKIVFITDDGNYWDLITNNSYKITNAVSKYKNVSVYVWLVDEQNDIDFRSKIWNINFNKNEQPDDVVPTEEQISGFDTMIRELNAGLEELETEYAKVEQGLAEVDNIDIDASKTGTIATVTITNKEGVEKSVQIEDGTDYVITQEDYQAIANVVETDITPLIPTKTSDLDNDSGFIDNTVNNLANYYDKTTSDGKYALITETGYRVELSVDSSTYVMTLNLKNKSGNILNTQTVDLPLETMVVNARYDSFTKEIVLTLQNGNTVRFSVADLVSGLQAEITSSNKLASDLVDDTNNTNKFVTTSEKTTWNSKYDKPSGGIPSTDLSSDVQASLGKADTAVQDVSGKEDKSNKVTSIDNESTDTQYPTAKLLYDQLSEKQEQIDELVAENTAFKKQIPTEHISTTSIQLTDSAEGLPIENVKLKGQTSQEQYNGYNLLPNNATTTTVNGITFTVNADGSVTINGTSTGVAYINLFLSTTESIITDTTKTYTYSKGVANSNIVIAIYEVINSNWTAKKYVITESTTYTPSGEQTGQIFRILVESGKTINNVTVFPMVVEGTSVGDYEPYVGGQASPSPAYPQLIHRVTGNCGSKFQNKNYWNDTLELGGINANTGANNTSTTNIRSANFTRVEPNETFVVSVSIASKIALRFYDESETFIESGTTSELGLDNVFTAPSNCEKIRIVLAGNTDLNTLVKIEKSSTASETYIAHAEQNAPLSLGNIEAYESDEIQIDCVQKAGYKKVTGARIVKNMKKLLLNSTTIAQLNVFYSNSLKCIGCISPDIANVTGSTAGAILCNKAPSLTRAEFTDESAYGICLNNSDNRFLIRFNGVQNYNTTELVKEYFTQNPYEVVHKLATPVITPITDSTLLAQLETLINMKTYKEVTNIDLTGEDLAPVLDCDYYQDMSTVKSDIASIKARLDLLEE